MTERSATHATFCIEREYPASPARVFKAFADPKAKAQWFGGPNSWTSGGATMDFRVGGREFHSSTHEPGGTRYTFEALYWDIIPAERIVFSYEMHLDGKKISVSLTTVELKPAGSGTKLTFTEQGAFLDGWDDPKLREQGTRELLDALGATLAKASADA